MYQPPPDIPKKVKVAVFSIPAEGHVNPMLAVVTALADRRDVAEVRSFGPPEVAECFSKAGATHVTIHSTDVTTLRSDQECRDLVYRSFILPLGGVVEAMRHVTEFDPDVILYDPFSLYGYVARTLLGVPTALLITFAGYGALTDDFVRQYSVTNSFLQAANEQYKQLSGVDILGNGFLPVFFPAGELSIITTIESLSVPLDAKATPLLHSLLSGSSQSNAFVGPCVGRVRMQSEIGDLSRSASAFHANRNRHCRTDPAFPFDMLESAKGRGKRILLFSLGTVLTGARFDTPVGGAPSGREYLKRCLRFAVDALGRDPDLVVVAALGQRLEVADEPTWPDNFIVRNYVPQISLLNDYADAFITHHGANSTTESILASVPMISMPGVGDQLAGAKSAIRTGTAVCLWDLADTFTTCSAELLRNAVQIVLNDCEYVRRCQELRCKMLSAGGAQEAARLIATLKTSRVAKE